MLAPDPPEGGDWLLPLHPDVLAWTTPSPLGVRSVSVWDPATGLWLARSALPSDAGRQGPLYEPLAAGPGWILWSDFDRESGTVTRPDGEVLFTSPRLLGFRAPPLGADGMSFWTTAQRNGSAVLERLDLRGQIVETLDAERFPGQVLGAGDGLLITFLADPPPRPDGGAAGVPVVLLLPSLLACGGLAAARGNFSRR